MTQSFGDFSVNLGTDAAFEARSEAEAEAELSSDPEFETILFKSDLSLKESVSDLSTNLSRPATTDLQLFPLHLRPRRDVVAVVVVGGDALASQSRFKPQRQALFKKEKLFYSEMQELLLRFFFQL